MGEETGAEVGARLEALQATKDEELLVVEKKMVIKP